MVNRFVPGFSVGRLKAGLLSLGMLIVSGGVTYLLSAARLGQTSTFCRRFIGWTIVMVRVDGWSVVFHSNRRKSADPPVCL